MNFLPPILKFSFFNLIFSVAASGMPNVLILLTDDQGTLDVNCYGAKDLKTPHMDSLAETGIRFTQAYAHTVCCPSRAALLTGRHPNRGGVQSWLQGDRNGSDAHLGNMDPSEITLAELLADQGYHTVHIGKWHLGRVNGMAAHEQGFAESLLMASGLYGRRDDQDVIQARQNFDPIDRFLWAALNFAASFNGGPRFEPPKYLTDYYTDQAVKVIEANKDRPFFLYLAHWAPHTPLHASKEDYEALSHIELHRERVYAAMIRSLDRGVGRVMQALKTNGIDENTLVMFTSDNGGAGYIGLPDVNEPYRGWKITLFEGGIRVPFLARWPARLPAGETFDAPVHHFDMYATAAAAAAAARGSSMAIEMWGLRRDGDGLEMNWRWIDAYSSFLFSTSPLFLCPPSVSLVARCYLIRAALSVSLSRCSQSLSLYTFLFLLPVLARLQECLHQNCLLAVGFDAKLLTKRL